MVPSLEFPSGRPFTIMDSALSHPEEYLEAVLSPRDRQDTKKNRIEDLHSKLMKSLLSSTLCSMEVMARSSAFHKKMASEDNQIRDLKAKVRALEKEKKSADKSLNEAETKIAELKGNMAAKEEELKVKTDRLDAITGELSEEKTKREEASVSLKNTQLELYNQLNAVFALRQELDTKEEAMKAAEEKFTRDHEAQFQDFVGQMEEAINENFLDGWEAAMKRLQVDITSETYKSVPFPNPFGTIPPFSFERPAVVSTPSVDEGQNAEGEGAAVIDLEVEHSTGAHTPEDKETIAKMMETARTGLVKVEKNSDHVEE